MEQVQIKNKTEISIHPATRIGAVSLTVADLDRQIEFYKDVLGFNLHNKSGSQAVLGTEGRELLHLVEESSYKRYQRVTGLYHFAVLYPNKHELARVIARLYSRQYPNYPTDHILTKSTYLDDPEGNGIELYTESPEDGEWVINPDGFYARRADGSLSNGREPLDLKALFSQLSQNDLNDIAIPKQTRIGHFHLHVGSIDRALDFYHGILGFDVMGKAENMGIAFVSAGGYHHHIGLNTWQGENAPSPPANALGLRYFSIEMPDLTSLFDIKDRIVEAGLSIDQTENGLMLHDPFNNGILLRTRV